MQAVLEKIIEKLEKEYEDLKEIYKSSKDYSFYHTYQGVNKAIEIVKQGCVADDVCEWKSMIFELKEAEKTSSK